MFRIATLVLFFFISTIGGCSRAPSPSGGNVAIVDLDRVATQLGLGEQWSAQMSQQQSQVNQQLAGYQQTLTEQLKIKHAELTARVGESAALPEAQQTQLVSYQQELNGQLRQAQSQAKQHLSGERNRLIQQFRQQAERISAQVAAERGYDVVLTKNETVVLTFAPATDITADVAAKMTAMAQAGASAAASITASRNDPFDNVAR